LAAFATAAILGLAQVNVQTYHNDMQRDGLNSQETVLTPKNVNSSSFGLLYTLPVDGQIYAQPLVQCNVAVPNQGTHNVVLVCTQNNSVYAFDTTTQGPPLWHVNLGPAVPNGDVQTGDINPQIGITGTPVIGPAIKGVLGGTATLYVVAKTVTTPNGNNVYTQTLYALDVTSGATKAAKVITGTVSGTGDGTDGLGHVPFNPLIQNQRPGLLYLSANAHIPVNTVYIAWASHGDNGPYHGWLMGFNATTLAPTNILNTTPNGKTDPSGYPLAAGGVWQGGAGLASDSANVFMATGNGSFNPTAGSYGDSIIHVRLSDFSILDYFTPTDQQTLDDYDEDLGSGGVLLLPTLTRADGGTKSLLVQVGKEGSIYLADRDWLGRNSPAGDEVYQELHQVIGGIWGMPAYWNNNVYFGQIYGPLVAYTLFDAKFEPTPSSSGNTYYQYPGPTPSVSSNGNSNGIVWAIQTANWGSYGPASLQAYDATNLSNELYDSGSTNGRDNMGPAIKFSVPTVANGYVYAGTGTELDVFGLGQWADAPILTWSGAFEKQAVITMIDNAPGAQIYYTTDGSIPTQNSTLYQGPVTFTTSQTVNAKAFAPGYGPSQVSTGYYQINPFIGSGVGLQGNYYNNSQNPSGPPTATELDPVINFNWNGNSPIAGVAGDNWAGQWNGTIEAETTSPYTFYTMSDDGVQVYINGQLIINDYTYHAATLDVGTINLVGGRQYTIQINYFQGGGASLLSLSWMAPGMPEQTVPTTQLYPAGQVVGPPSK
jgi:PA14 domain/Chitobiase/beta-hexosaminidase C-terminal domain